jgi:hypothetical protein
MTDFEKRNKLEKEIHELEASRDALVTTQSHVGDRFGCLGIVLIVFPTVALIAIALMVFIHFWAPFVLGQWCLYLSPAYLIAARMSISTYVYIGIKTRRRRL